MAQYTQVLGAPKNRLLIDGVELDLFNKRAIIDSYSKGSWDSVDITNSKTSIRDSMVLYHGELHFIGSSSADPTVGMHCKFDGTNWTSDVSTLPYNPSYCKAIVLNDEIHIFGGGCTSLTPKKDLKQMKYHYKWDDTSNTWTKVSTLPYYFFNGSAVIINGQVHLLGGGRTDTTKKKHYYFNGKSWKSGKSLPLKVFGQYQAVTASRYSTYQYGTSSRYLFIWSSRKVSTNTYKSSVYNYLDLSTNKWSLSGNNAYLFKNPQEEAKVLIMHGQELWNYSIDNVNTDKDLIYTNIVETNMGVAGISGKIYDDYINLVPNYLTDIHMIFFNGKLCIFATGDNGKIFKSCDPIYTLTIEDK